MIYKGYIGVVEYNEDARIGSPINTKTVITFQSKPPKVAPFGGRVRMDITALWLLQFNYNMMCQALQKARI